MPAECCIVAVSDTYRDDILSGMKYPPLAFSPVNWCKIDVFSLNMMALHHKMSQTMNERMNERKAEIQEKMNIN